MYWTKMMDFIETTSLGLAEP